MEALWERLVQWEKSGALPFHMPGHKRNRTLAPYLDALSAGLDVTEIPGFDDLHAPEEILKLAMERAARLYGSEDAYFLVNGSTGGILAGIRAATRRGDRVLVARACHKAVYHALELCALQPIYLQQDCLDEFACPASLAVEQVEEALGEHPDIRLVILTSPSYEGVCSDIPSIVEAAHRRGVPVFVDEAHGAHLGLGGGFPPGAVAAGADLVVQSFHKTLPSLTQTAMLHRSGTLVSREELTRQLGIFQTSSPSYLLLASLEGCVSLLEQRGEDLLQEWRGRLHRFDQGVHGLTHLRLLPGTERGVFARDPSKIVIGTKGSGMTGLALSQRLRQEFGIQLEMAAQPYAIAMTGMGDTDQAMEKLKEALLTIDGSCQGEGDGTPLLELPLPKSCLSMEEALTRPFRLCPWEEASEQLAAESIWAYPPGIPLVVPGEVISAAMLAALSQRKAVGVNLISTRGDLNQGIAVVDSDTFFAE